MDRADCPVFMPTRKEMSGSFEKYIAGVEQECQPYGICKITSPKGWTPCAQGYSGQDFDLDIARIEQNITRETMAAGVYTASMTPLRKQTVRSFKEATEVLKERQLRPPVQHLDSLPGLESAYWRTIPGSTEYGADNEGSLFDEGVKGWNLAKLDSCLSRGLASDPSGHKLKGVNTPYLYYGRWKATFAWHTEDMDLHSVNYLHYGAPKVWYCVPPSEREKMDAFIAKKLYAQHGRCREFMRHKTVLIKPEVLEANGITVQKVVQHPGDFIINFPGAYHSGFNVGFNCAESTNFATPAWIQHGAVAQFCCCTPHQEPVRLDMGLFLSEAPDNHTRQLVRLRMAKDKAARGEAVDATSDATLGSGCHQDSCRLPCKHSKVKTKGKKAPARVETNKPQKAVERTQKAAKKPQTAVLKPQNALAKPQKAANKLKTVVAQLQTAVDKPFRVVKRIKKELTAKQGSKSTKADTKQMAAALKAAKRAAQAPAATAKLPQPRKLVRSPPAAPSSSQDRSTKSSPSKARGRPKGSTKAAIAAAPSPSPDSSVHGPQHPVPAHQQQAAPTQSHDQPQHAQWQQPACDGSEEAKSHKRKRVSMEGGLRVLRRKTTEAFHWLSSLSDNPAASETLQAEWEAGDALQAQQRQDPKIAQHTAQHAQRSSSGPGSSSQYGQDGGEVQAGLEQQVSGGGGDEAEVESADEAASGEAAGGDQHGHHQAGAAPAKPAEGNVYARTILPATEPLQWHSTKTRSQRAYHRTGAEGCPSTFQRLLCR